MTLAVSSSSDPPGIALGAAERGILTRNPSTAQTQPSGTPGLESSGGDFLAREQALLGSDADQFTTGNDNAAFVEDGDDDDLLGGGGGGNEEVTEFESSFPAIDTSNEVCPLLIYTLIAFGSNGSNGQLICNQ